jgi:hypothetical protein
MTIVFASVARTRQKREKLKARTKSKMALSSLKLKVSNEFGYVDLQLPRPRRRACSTMETLGPALIGSHRSGANRCGGEFLLRQALRIPPALQPQSE